MYLIEKEMRESSEEWVFPIYSAYNDDAYDKYLIQIDEDRILILYIHSKKKFMYVQFFSVDFIEILLTGKDFCPIV